MEGGGTGRGFFINPAGASEFTIEQGAGSAEYSGGGININLIPKTGSNKFEAYFFTNWTNHGLQANNLTSELMAKGLTAVNGVKDVYEVNGAVGGPIMNASVTSTERLNIVRRPGVCLAVMNSSISG